MTAQIRITKSWSTNSRETDRTGSTSAPWCLSRRSAAIDRVDRPAFFARFNEDDAVLYFYEPLDDDGNESAGVFLTNALTGWEPRTTKPLPFSQLEEERDRRRAGETGPRDPQQSAL